MNLIDKLPTSYQEINYKTYIKILQAIPDEIPDGWDYEEYKSYLILVPLSILLDIPVIDLELLPATELIPMIERTAFMNTPFKEAKTALNVKQANELTYDEYVNYQKLRESQWDNMPQILRIIIKDKTPTEIDQLSIETVMSVFFCLNRSTVKSLQSLKKSLAMQVVKLNLKRIWQMAKNLFSKVQ